MIYLNIIDSFLILVIIPMPLVTNNDNSTKYVTSKTMENM